MWQLGSERIVGKSEVTVEQAPLTRTKGRSLILAADGRRGTLEQGCLGQRAELLLQAGYDHDRCLQLRVLAVPQGFS